MVRLEEILQKFYEKQNEYDNLKDMIIKLQETIISLKETYEYTICVRLRIGCKEYTYMKW